MKVLSTIVLLEALFSVITASDVVAAEDSSGKMEHLNALRNEKQTRQRRMDPAQRGADLERMDGGDFGEGGVQRRRGATADHSLGGMGKRRPKKRRSGNPDDPQDTTPERAGLGVKRRPRSPDDGGEAVLKDTPPVGEASAPLYAKRLREAEAPIELYPSGVLPKYTPTDYSPLHNTDNNAIFAAFYSTTLMPRDVRAFLGTARKYFSGDLVVSVHPGMKPDIIELFKKYSAIVYEIPLNCDEKMSLCSFDAPGTSLMVPVPIAMLRFYIYQFWAQMYSTGAKLMIADSRDVMFQADPFAYNTYEWQGTELAVFLEAHPNMVINRCTFNSGWIRNCYGENALKQIGYHTVSCSGVTMGTRNGILIYTMLVASSLDPAVRGRRTPLDASSVASGLVNTEGGGGDSTSIVTVQDNSKCIAHGMDQGIHNWLLYSGVLGRVFGNKVTVFDQGSGPVNTIGGFFGDKKIMKLDLFEVGIFKRNAKEKIVVYNWNGQPSPVVHQYDRFSSKYFAGTMGQGILDAIDGLI